MVTIVRSVAFNVLFYLNTALFLIIALPTFVMPYQAIVEVAKTWGRVNLFLLRLVAGVGFELRGREKIPQGALIVAAKHQSAWETFALMHLFRSPAFIMKRELQWIPIFGWLTIKGRMVGVDRGARARALIRMAERARAELARGRQIIIFPEGTRRPVGAAPSYKSGIAFLYSVEGVACLPVALNSGVFWPRRSILRRPGTVVVEILDPIPPGLEKTVFTRRLKTAIETASARLVAEAETQQV
jgi:1-acyl-sn-glycerol-3-phosphate acyltransferase